MEPLTCRRGSIGSRGLVRGYHRLRRFAALAILAATPCLSGCYATFPSDFISGFILDTQISCSELATDFDLPPAPPELLPSDAGLDFESFAVTSRNGSEVQAWFIPAQADGELIENPIGTVLVLHGSEGSRDCYLPWAAVAVENGFHAAVFDYQGFDDSEGTADIATLLDDSEAVLQWIRSDDSAARQRVHLMAVSLGTGPALALARERPGELSSVALDGTFNPLIIQESVIQSLGCIFPLLGASVQEGFAWLFETHAHLEDISLPVMFLNGGRDRRTPVDAAEQVFDAVGSTLKTFWVFEEAAHVRPLFQEEARYVSLVVSLWRNPQQPPDPELSVTDPTVRLPMFDISAR